MKRAIDFNTAVGLVLRAGVIVSFTIVGVGSAMMFAEGQTGYSSLGSAEQLYQMHDRFLLGFAPLVSGVLSAKPYAIIDLGLLILLATPVARVFVSFFLFLGERRYSFVLITLGVLSLLLFSMFVVGPLVSG